MSTETGLEQDRAPVHGPREQLRDVTSGDVTAALDGDVDAWRCVGGGGGDADDCPALVLLQYQLAAALTNTIPLGVVRRHAQQVDVVDRNCSRTNISINQYYFIAAWQNAGQQICTNKNTI